MTAPTLEEVYGEMNCAGTYFIAAQAEKSFSSTEVIKVEADKLDSKAGYYRTTISLKENEMFVGVRAVINRGIQDDVSYLPA